LIQGGVDAVVAMGATVLVTCTTRYVQAFYRTLLTSSSVATAQQQARQALYDNPNRSSPNSRQEGMRIALSDWWVPHYYQQRSLVLQSAKRKRKRKTHSATVSRSHGFPHEPDHGFSGRSRELHQLERWLLQG